MVPLNIIIRSYVNIKIKIYQEKTYITDNKILIFYGIIGTIIFIIICFISSFVECSSSSIFSVPNTYNSNYVCKVLFINETKDFDPINIQSKNGSIYLDNFFFFKIFEKSDFSERIKEIIIILFAGITFYFYKYFSLRIIGTLSPTHFVFSNQIYFSIIKIILPIYTIINEGTFFAKNHINFIKAKYILDMSNDYFSLFAFLIYLEIIELNCYGLNKNLRRNIINRSLEESFNLLEIEQKNDNDDDSNKEKKEKEEKQED